jgi:hypothetical protein
MLSVQNVGTGTLAGEITVNDAVPAGLDVVSAAGTGWTCGVSGQDVTCTVTPPGGLASGPGYDNLNWAHFRGLCSLEFQRSSQRLRQSVAS